MIAPETLLTMHPLDALRAQIGERLKAPLKSSHLKIEKPTSLGGKRTGVTVSIDKSRAPLELWDRVGSFPFEYDRIDLAQFTAGVDLKVKAQLPATPQILLRNVFYPYAIPVVDGDLVDARFTTLGSADVIAADESWRWVGEISILINQLGIEIPTLIMVDHFTFSFTADYRSVDVKNRIVTHLNLANVSSLPTPIVASMFTLGDPQVNGGIEEGDNTVIELTFNGSPYIGSFKVFYGRRSFQRTFRWPVPIGMAPLANTALLATVLSEKLGCVITANDIAGVPFPEIAVGQKIKFPVNFKATSLAYVGSVLVEYSRTS